MLAIWALLTPFTLAAAATGRVGRGQLPVHAFYAARAEMHGKRAWKLALAAVAAGAMGATIGSQFVVGGEGVGLPQALIGMQLAQLGVIGYDAARVQGSHWSGLVRGDRRPATTAALGMAWLAPAIVLSVGLLRTRTFPIFSGFSSLPVLVPGLIVAGFGLFIGRAGADFGRWYLAHQALHGGCLAAYSVVIPVLGVRTAMSGLVYPVLGAPMPTVDPGTVVAAACAGCALVGWLFHAGRLAVLPRVVAADTLTPIEPTARTRRLLARRPR